MGKKKIITKGEENAQETGQTGQIKVEKRSGRKQISKGTVHISSTYNNTIVTVTDPRGEVITWTSAGSMGFKGARKSTPYAATLVAQNAAEKSRQSGLTEATVIVRGIGPGREAAIRGLISAGLNINEIVDDTPMPHNGVRAPRPRRV